MCQRHSPDEDGITRDSHFREVPTWESTSTLHCFLEDKYPVCAHSGTFLIRSNKKKHWLADIKVSGYVICGDMWAKSLLLYVCFIWPLRGHRIFCVTKRAADSLVHPFVTKHHHLCTHIFFVIFVASSTKSEMSYCCSRFCSKLLTPLIVAYELRRF